MSFYMIALHINPYVGNAYNQLGLLEAYLRSQLGAVVYAIKGLLVDRPFRTSANNLSTTFTRIYNGIAHSRPHSEKKSQKNDQNYKRNFENSFLEMIAISLFDLSTADTYFCKKMNGLFEELSVIISQNIDSSEVYMFGILVIPVGMLHLHFSQQSSPGDFMVLNPKSIDKLVHIVLKFLSTLLIVSSHEIPNSECHMRLLKIINLGLHWLRSNKSLFAPSVRNALAMSKNELANFYSELYFEDFKDANLSSSKPARGDVPLDEYINYGMFAPFKNLSRLGRPAGREHNADRQSVDKDASRVRIKSIADSILIILDIPALPPAPTIPLTDSLEQKTTQKKKPLIARVEIPSTVGITGSGVRFHPDNEDIQTDLGFFAGYTDPYCSMPSKITGPLDAHDGSREFGGEHQRPSTLIRSVFNASSDSFHPHLSGTPLLQDMLMYPYGSCDVQRLAEGETRSIDTPYIGTIDAPASDTGRHISSDPVNTISFLGLENYSAPFDNPNSKPPPSLSPTG